jgi:hypothetical protein
VVAVEGAPVDAIRAELVAVAMRQRRPDRALLARAAAGRDAISFGADPVLTLAEDVPRAVDFGGGPGVMVTSLRR